MNCTKHNCSDSQFTCDNGRCISSRWKCDGENDCRDNSDEKNCAPNTDTCKIDEFMCVTGNTRCISSQWRCDGEKDCLDNSDEVGCNTNHTCTDFQFSCEGPGKSGECIYKSWVCDGDRDCKNGADEEDCKNDSVTNPPFVNPFAPTVSCKRYKCLSIS